MNKIFEDIYREFDKIILEVLNSDRRDMRTIIKEKSYYLSNRISDLICDTVKFEEIVNNIFDKDIKNKLLSIPSEFTTNISELKSKYPELSEIEEIIISLQHGDKYSELGSISDFTKINKFKITLFLDAIMYIELGFDKLNSSELQLILSEKQLDDFYTGIKRTLIHELSHILDSFQIDMNELLKDFEEKEYGLNKSELKAHQAAFIYHFWKENGAQYAQSIEEFNKFISKIEKLKCWNEIGPLLNNSEVKKKYTVFLRKVYNYFRHHNILEESGDLPIKKTYYVKPSDIAGLMTQSEKKWANKIIYELHPELLHPEMEPSFFNRSIEMQKAIVTCYIDRPELMRPHLKNEVAKLISNKQISIKNYYIK